jgi:hypothetical protein
MTPGGGGLSLILSPSSFDWSRARTFLPAHINIKMSRSSVLFRVDELADLFLFLILRGCCAFHCDGGIFARARVARTFSERYA